jgi:hypothetical protein
MSAAVFVLTSPSLTDMSDSINLAEARARFYAAELQGDIALADWARAYAPPLLDFAIEAPTDDAISDAADQAASEAKSEVVKAIELQIDDLLSEAAPAFKAIETLHHKLEALAADAGKVAA